MLAGALIIAGLILFLLLFFISIVSFRESEFRAAQRSFWAAFILPVPYFILSSANFHGKEIYGYILLGLTLLVGIILFFPVGKKRITEDDTPKDRIDERDIMFARNRLVPGSQRYNEYYKNNPDLKPIDDGWRKKPGLAAPRSTYYDPLQAASAEASFITVAQFHQHVETEPAAEKQSFNPHELTNYIKAWGKKLGAAEVGITQMHDFHFYSKVGRGDDYGTDITPKHKYGICFIVEMDRDTMRYAPKGPTMMESAQQYMVSGAIAMQVKEFISQLGHPARAHIDGKYQVVAPLVARDAGLGDIGRMGLLMTPRLGPRVRISVVTTDIPLVPDERLFDYSIVDFCMKCKKCANVCPGNSISFNDPENIGGIKRWQINRESCFDFWCQAGTDCGRCVSVCPYSHPDNLLHNSVRFGIRNSSLFRSFAVKMDDLLYGKIPPSVQPPNWYKVKRD